MFIAVDGIDGSGKTTLVHQLAELFAPRKSLITKEPTADSEWGIVLRDAAGKARLSRETEIEYFHKDRLHHIETVIKPALKLGKIVLTDRYVDSTLAFQASDPEEAEAMFQSFASEILIPDLTLILDCPVEIGLARVGSRDGGALSVFETTDTLSRAREIYRSRTGDHYAILDASGTIESTFEQAQRAIQNQLFHLHTEPGHDFESIEEEDSSTVGFQISMETKIRA